MNSRAPLLAWPAGKVRLVAQVLDITGKLWTLPNTLLGLLLGFVGWAGGADRPRLGNNAVQFTNHPLLFGAMTLGNVIIYGRNFGPDYRLANGTVADHERQHTYQAQLLGPFYLLSNVLGLLVARCVDGDTHGPSNWNERGPQANPPRAWV